MVGSVLITVYFRWDGEKEIESQFNNYQRLMNHINSRPDMRIQVRGQVDHTLQLVTCWSCVDYRYSLGPCRTISLLCVGAAGSVPGAHMPSPSSPEISSLTVTVTTTTGVATSPPDHSTSTWTGSWKPG